MNYGVYVGASDRRKETRFKGHLPVEMEQGRGVTRDLSAQGVYFETDLSLPIGEHIEFAIPLVHSDLSPSFRILFKGEVVRVESTVGKIGIAAAIHSYSFKGLHETQEV